MTYYRGILLFNGDKFKNVRIGDEDFAEEELCMAYLKSLTRGDDRWQIVFDTGKGMFTEDELNGKIDEAAKIFSVALYFARKGEASNGR